MAQAERSLPGGAGAGGSRFPFPFTPYPSQERLMSTIHSAIEDKACLIAESPTGTGKSLGIICSTLHWLRSQHAPLVPESAQPGTESPATAGAAAPSWLLDQAAQQADEARQRRVRRYEYAEQALRRRIQDARRPGFLQEHALEPPKGRRRTVRSRPPPSAFLSLCRPPRHACEDQTAARSTAVGAPGTGTERGLEEGDEDFLLGDDVDQAGASEDAELEARLARSDRERSRRDDALRAIADSAPDVGDVDASAAVGKEAIRVLYCSRTHSQLAQFVEEIRKTAFADARVTTLGARAQLCVNDSVRRLGHPSLVNDKCADLIRSKAKAAPAPAEGGGGRKRAGAGPAGGCGCSFYRPDRRTLFRDASFAAPRDIEDLTALGREATCCPYFGVRASLPWAEIVAMPYSVLLHRGTREALGVPLEGAVVVLDEAHNIIDAVNSAHAARASLRHVSAAVEQLEAYWGVYRTRLGPKNAMRVRQLLALLQAIAAALHKGPPPVGGGAGDATPRLLDVSEFLVLAGVDHFNIYDLLHFASASNLANKLRGFVEKRSAAVAAVGKGGDEGEQGLPRHLSGLHLVGDFLRALATADADGRVLWSPSRGDQEPNAQFVLLNPALHFREVVDQARSVLLLGGTMAPMDDLVRQLFGHLPPSRVRTLTVDHVVPPSHVLPLAVTAGPDGKPLHFNYKHRGDEQQWRQLGLLLLAVTRAVPGGVVTFFPSFDALARAKAVWTKPAPGQPDGPTLWSALDRVKHLFEEPRAANKVDQVLTRYGTAVHERGGGHLFCVVGAKMSEGINFADDLARVVAVVGLPYPSVDDPVLRERMRYLDARFAPPPSSTASRSPGQQLYENLCMRAVNQSIGRAIRHRSDYAAMLLIDARYGSPRVSNGLPGWIAPRLATCSSLRSVIPALRGFFATIGSQGSGGQ